MINFSSCHLVILLRFPVTKTNRFTHSFIHSISFLNSRRKGFLIFFYCFFFNDVFMCRLFCSCMCPTTAANQLPHRGQIKWEGEILIKKNMRCKVTRLVFSHLSRESVSPRLFNRLVRFKFGSHLTLKKNILLTILFIANKWVVIVYRCHIMTLLIKMLCSVVSRAALAIKKTRIETLF